MTTTSNRRHLVLFTNNYPYGSGEYFLENEIPEIAPAFDDITIIANANSEKITRKLPDNCHAFNFPIDRKHRLFLRIIIRHPLNIAQILLHELPKIFSTRPNILLKRIRSLLTIVIWGEEKFFRTKEIIKAYSPDTTTIYSYWMDHNGYVASRLRGENNNLYAVCRAHGCDLYTERNDCDYLPLRTFIANHLDHVVFICRHGQNYFLNKFPAVNKTIVSRLGTKRLTNEVSSTSTGQVHQLLSVSNLIPLKQVHLIIEALALCKTKWRWTHFGDGPERSKLEQLALTKGTHCHFMGAVSNQTIIDYYATNAVDCFINVSSSEGLPVSIMEALSFGVPVIAPAVNGIPEIVSNEVGVLLSTKPSIQEIATALDTIANLDSHQITTTRITARKFWEDNYNAEVVFKKFIDVLKEI